MLKFWKKSGIKENDSDSIGSPPRNAPTHNISAIDSFEIEEVLNSASCNSVVNYSRLSKPLVEIMRDSEGIGYFIQYLETMNVTTLAKCLLDIDNFNSLFTSSSNLVPWSAIKCINKVINNTTGQYTWKFTNGIDYTNNIACDISNYLGIPSDSCYIDGKTFVRAISESRLAEMQQIEQNALAKLLKKELISESTVDALQIFYKYFSYSAPFKIILNSTVFQNLVNNFKSDINHEVFSEVRNLIFNVLNREFYNEYLKSECHCKYEISILTGSEVNICDILYNESALFYFMEYLENEGSRGFLEFWMAANNFKQQYVTMSQTYDAQQAQTDAMVLYDKFFSLQATQPLNLGDKIRCLIEESICREDGPLPTCFDAVQLVIIRILESRFLSLFLQSQLYFNFLSELISTVNSGPLIRQGGSDCSSEMSISMTNTLLVSEDGHTKRDGKNWEQSNLSIDAQQLYDPDSLWRRGRHAGLIFGRVNALGRFQTDLEPEPDRKIGLETRLSKAVKKLVNLEENKTKEEMAWQVAEMIVKDVTNLTMPSTQN